jgi:phosphate transport system substrate-binding protein
VIACRVLGVPYAWIYPEPTGHPWRNQPDVSEFFLSTAARGYEPRNYEFLLATLRVVAKPAAKDQERTAIMINSLLAASTSTHDAYVNLVEGRSDLNLAARPPSESELKLAKEKGVTIKLEPVARDAFVIIVNRKNPVQGLTRQQVREMYEEKITNWKAVGGDDGKIRPFRRERDSGSRELFDALVMQGQTLSEDKRFRDLYANSMGGPFSQVTQQHEGVGYSIYYYEHFMAASPFTRTLAIDGVEPTAESIASGKYPWVTRIYVAYRDGEDKNSPGMKLLRWLSSPEGQAVVRESGYVPER